MGAAPFLRMQTLRGSVLSALTENTPLTEGDPSHLATSSETAELTSASKAQHSYPRAVITGQARGPEKGRDLSEVPSKWVNKGGARWDCPWGARLTGPGAGRCPFCFRSLGFWTCCLLAEHRLTDNSIFQKPLRFHRGERLWCLKGPVSFCDLAMYNWKDKVGLHPRFQQRLPKTRGIS